MTEEEHSSVSESEESVHVDGGHEQEGEAQEEKMVPLKALQAEKRKRQDAESRRQEAENQISWFKQQASSQTPREDDSEELLTKGELRKLSQTQQMQIKREVLEESFLIANPTALETINNELEEILQKRPFLANAIESSSNRYATAWQIVQDYSNKGVKGSMTQKMKENEKKPGSPVNVGRSGQMSSSEALSKMSQKEFRDYRKQLRAKR